MKVEERPLEDYVQCIELYYSLGCPGLSASIYHVEDFNLDREIELRLHFRYILEGVRWEGVS